MSCVMIEDGQSLLSFRSSKQIEHVEPDRDVEHRDWLIRQQDTLGGGQRAGDGHPLPLTAAQLVRILAR